MIKFKDCKQTLYGYPCVSLGSAAGEKCIAGKRGDIWDYDGRGTCKYFFVSLGGNEILKTCNSKDLPRVISNLEVPLDREEQAYWANNPNARHLRQE